MRHSRPGLQLSDKVVLRREEIAEVAEKVVENIGLIALANRIQIDGRFWKSECNKLKRRRRFAPVSFELIDMYYTYYTY